MMLISHPIQFTYGHRVLFLKGRHKDGCHDQRIFSKHTTNKMEFREALEEFERMAQPGERIYASASPRNIDKAIRAFKHAMLDNDYQDDHNRHLFYAKIKDRWISALMQRNCVSREEQNWLIDCDTPEEEMAFRLELQELGVAYYEYATKNGRHLIIQPTNRDTLSDALDKATDLNALMLWGY